MELVYLWVEEYKNIHRQGFNFSSRFRCEYDPESNALTIDENDDYIENFFGDNINVTAIVGKNGSGKSSIQSILEDIYLGSLGFNFIFCFILNNQKYYIAGMSEFVNSSKFTNRYTSPLPLITYSAEMPYSYFEWENSKYEDRGPRISFHQNDIFEIIIQYLGTDVKITSFLYAPKLIEFEQNEALLYDFITEIRPAPVVRSMNPENGAPFEDCHDDRESYNTENILEAYYFSDIVNNDYAAELCSTAFYNPQHLLYDAEILESFYNEKGLNEEGYSLEEFRNILEKSVITIEDHEYISLLKKYSRFLTFNFEDSLGRRYLELSHGEKSIYSQFIYIYNRLEVSDRLCIVFDEPDLSLHPNWQKKYLFEFGNSFFSLGKHIHFIFTTHSPFLLSDIPKQNIIFLDTDKEGKCMVVDGLKEKKETFGANIHTLLSDSFFMRDGLMGEFAKKKIEELIDYLNDKDSSIKDNIQAQVFINIIGEPIIKSQLQKMLDSKRLTKIDEIDTIKTEISELEKRLKEIEDANAKS